MKELNLLKTLSLVLAFLILGACGMNLVPSKDAWYMQHYIIMQDFERTAYKKLSDEGKQKFQSLFWEVRTAEAKKVFLSRMDQIMKVFKKENVPQPWNTDRARIFLLNGKPASIEYKQNDSWQMQVREGAGQGGITERDNEDIQARTDEVWTYQFGEHYIYYTFAFSAPKRWKLAQGSFAGNRYLGAFETQNKEQTYRIVNIDLYTKELENLKNL